MRKTPPKRPKRRVEGGPSDERRSVHSISEMWILTIKMWKILGKYRENGRI